MIVMTVGNVSYSKSHSSIMDSCQQLIDHHLIIHHSLKITMENPHIYFSFELISFFVGKYFFADSFAQNFFDFNFQLNYYLPFSKG